MIDYPKAKINVGLNIVSKREDGYHDIETLFYPIDLTDRLEIREARETRLETTGLPIEGEAEQNLVMRALRMMQREYGLPEMEVHLEKRIPMGAGLGGGSSDAASVLRMVNEMYGLGLSTGELCGLAVRLGADCPFFVHSRPMSASGIGEVLTPTDIDLSGYDMVLVKPDIHVSTAEAYANCVPKPWEVPLAEVVKEKGTWREELRNDFEVSVFAKYPILAGIKDALYGCGAWYAAMSGSGSTIYGLFDAGVMKRVEIEAEMRRITGDTGVVAYFL